MENKRLYGLVCCLQRQMSRENHKFFSEYGITHVQMHAMVYIHCETKNGRTVCQRDIEKQVNLRPSATSTLITNLERGGLIVRTVAEGDARTKNLTLTEKGESVCLRNKQFMEKCDNIVQSALTEEEQEIFRNLLLKIMAESKKEVKDD